MGFKSGFIAIIGKPNVGKSTLLNAIVGQKISITSNKPQTTREKIAGILTLPDAQLIFLDSPGFEHQFKSRLSKFMAGSVQQTLQDADVIMFVMDVLRPLDSAEESLMQIIKKKNKPIVLVLNKVDQMNKAALLTRMKERFDLQISEHIIPVSALKNDGIDDIVKTIVSLLEEGPKHFGDDEVTDMPVRHFIEEMIREKIFRQTYEEIPYSTCVMVEQFMETPKRIKVEATIYVERETHKGIIIGDGGERIKQVGTDARLELEELLSKKVFLGLHVKVKDSWKNQDEFLSQLLPTSSK